MRARNTFKEHQETLNFHEKLAVFINKKIGTMYCAYLFAVIGIGSLVGVITNNTVLGLICGAVSSYFIQLVLLPLIMVAQNLESRHTEKRAEHEYNLVIEEEREAQQILQKLDSIIEANAMLLKMHRRKK